MQFIKVGEFDVVTRITGPQHHYLGLVISDEGEQSPLVAEIAMPGGSWALLKRDFLSDPRCAAILRGVATANERLGTHYTASKFRLVASDPPAPAVYETLAEKLVDHVARERSRNDSQPASFSGRSG